MSSRHSIVLATVLRAVKPLVRLLLRHGVTYPAFAAALKRVFLEAAQQELARGNRPPTDSALTLLSGVHRRDVRELTRGEAQRSAGTAAQAAPLGQAGEVVARWMAHPAWRTADGHPRRLLKGGGAGSFDALVAEVSRDVRPRAMLDELLRLGAVVESDAGIELAAAGFAPRRGFAEVNQLLADNLSDHAAASVANLEDGRNLLEQAIYVDELTADSVAQLQKVATRAWKSAFETVMHEAQARFDADARDAMPEQRTHRARFGAYYFSQDTREPPQ